MPTSFVSIGEFGFWMRDEVLETWLRLLALHLPEPTEDASPVYALRNHWLLQSKGYFLGFVTADLDRVVSDPVLDGAVRTAIDLLTTTLEHHGGTIDCCSLCLLGSEGRVQDIESARLIEVGKAFLMLMDGKITTGAACTDLFPGSRPLPT